MYFRTRGLSRKSESGARFWAPDRKKSGPATNPPPPAGSCGRPPKPGVRTFAFVAIVLMVAVWIVLPLLVALAFAL